MLGSLQKERDSRFKHDAIYRCTQRRKSSKIRLLIASFAVAGCASTPDEMTTQGEVETVSLAPTSYRTGSVGSLISFDPAAGSLTFMTGNGGGATLELDESDDTLVAGWADYSTSDVFAFAKESSTGQTAAVLATGPALDDVNMTETLRQTQTNMPTSGSMTYQGDYLGLVSTAGTRTAHDIVTGDAVLTADFGQSEVSGAITNREGMLSNNAFPDLTLEVGRIFDHGRMFGRVDLFEFETDGQQLAAYGSYDAIVTGANGQETAANVLIYYNNAGTGERMIENGAFVGEATPPE